MAGVELDAGAQQEDRALERRQPESVGQHVEGARFDGRRRGLQVALRHLDAGVPRHDASVTSASAASSVSWFVLVQDSGASTGGRVAVMAP